MKTKEELNELKEEVKALNKKLAELTEDELAEVTGGGKARAIIASGTAFPFLVSFEDPSKKTQYENNIYTFDTREEAERKFFGE